jgi:HEAT repeat protein
MSLEARLTDPNPEVREAALMAVMVSKGPSPQELLAVVDCLRDDSSRIREVAATTLRVGASLGWECEPISSAVPLERLLPVLGDRSATVRQTVLWALGFYPADERARTGAESLLNDSVPLIRVRAAAVVWVQSGDTTGILPVVAEAIRSGEPDAVVAGCGLLMSFGPLAGAVVPLVWDYLQHPDGFVRGNAAYVLYKCCPEKSILAQAADLLEGRSDNGAADALIRYAAYKLRKAAEAEHVSRPPCQ